MRTFLHDRARRFEEVLESGNTALRASVAATTDVVPLVDAFFILAATNYRSVGAVTGENLLLALHAELAAARRGVPLGATERVTTRRSELQRSVALDTLVRALDRVRADVLADRDALGSARDQLAPIVAYAVQEGVLPVPGGGPEDQWRRLGADRNVGPAARQVLVHVAVIDAALLTAELLATLAGTDEPATVPAAVEDLSS